MKEIGQRSLGGRSARWLVLCAQIGALGGLTSLARTADAATKDEAQTAISSADTAHDGGKLLQQAVDSVNAGLAAFAETEKKGTSADTAKKKLDDANSALSRAKAEDTAFATSLKTARQAAQKADGETDANKKSQMFDDAVKAAQSAKTHAETSNKEAQNAINLAKAMVELDAACTAHCQGDLVVCLDASSGEVFCAEASKDKQLLGALPRRALTGDQVIIRAIGKNGTSFDLATALFRSTDAILRVQKQPPKVTGPTPAAGPYEVLKEATVSIPDDTAVQALTISITPVGKPTMKYNVPIDHGKYFVEMGLLMPLVINGSRKVVGTPLPGTGHDQTLTEMSDLRAVPALSLSWFPGGRRRGGVSSFKGPVSAAFADLLGVQAAVGLDLSKPPDFYFGGVFEPVSGLSVSVGAAVLQGQFIPENYKHGMILPRGEALVPDTKYMARFYVGFTATTDILTSITSAYKMARGVSFN